MLSDEDKRVIDDAVAKHRRKADKATRPRTVSCLGAVVAALCTFVVIVL